MPTFEDEDEDKLRKKKSKNTTHVDKFEKFDLYTEEGPSDSESSTIDTRSNSSSESITSS